LGPLDDHASFQLKKKMVENNIPQSVELGYLRVVASFFGSHQSAHVFPQKAPSGLVRIQEL
jgi:hypothetical protein